jgi:FAD/FMN-containing dehydrogenase
MAIKNATGYNLTGAVAGSRGTLGVVVEVILRMTPLPRDRHVDAFVGDEPLTVWDAARTLSGRARAGGRLESSTITAVEVRADFGEAGAILVVESDGDASDDARSAAIVRLASDRLRRVSLSDFSLGLATRSVRLRAGFDPTLAIDRCAEILQCERARQHQGMVTLEATSGAIEVSIEGTATRANEARELYPELHPSSQSATLRSALKRAFDPDGLLRSTVPGSGSNEIES